MSAIYLVIPAIINVSGVPTYVSAATLMSSFGVTPDQCVVLNSQEFLMTSTVALSGLIQLTPQYSGVYTLP